MTFWIIGAVACFLMALLTQQFCGIREARLKDAAYAGKNALRDFRIKIDQLETEESQLAYAKSNLQSTMYQLEQEVEKLQSQVEDLGDGISGEEEEQIENGGQGTGDEANSESPSSGSGEGEKNH